LLKRRTRLKQYFGSFPTTKELHGLLVAQAGLCALTYLPLPERPHLDHIVPRVRGGDSSVGNLQWVSPMANHAKGDMTGPEFQAWVLAAADAIRARRQAQELM